MERISYTAEFSSKQFNIQKRFSTDATIHATQDLIYSIHNPALAISLIKLENEHNKALISLAEIFIKATPPISTSKGASKGVIPRKTPTGEPRKTK